MKKLILFLVLGVLLSCQSTDNRRLEKTLDLAQSNIIARMRLTV